MSARQFPVLRLNTLQHVKAEDSVGCPRSVPWELLDQHAEQAMRNHAQTLERLAERGGLAPFELVAVLTDRHWGATVSLSPREAARQFVALIAERAKGGTR